ncbi:hypothetical protein BHE74_00003490 [Ensete ventricosum]|uniref:Uncharacterized protein n=1 Tax=Ensete ventricosum TaxID=4639 RepID=A0A444FM12_ENSVE|nr:hypothetical protein B296_00005009 [Ensete ventricosum]RWW23651.1 hypothetical protein GW17_00012095 [Ensete ventricosum]RWW87663.1 hypothetical protein BHE74_00003490 [Ensete ventricosum]RZS15702.1 hypothetical protein BHM03_00047567 [Ensete ventricosum]
MFVCEIMLPYIYFDLDLMKLLYLTFVLDVHPFNPRIAMSAGYDGKMIIWDIWEGKPVRIYETGHYRLVDGKFSP